MVSREHNNSKKEQSLHKRTLGKLHWGDLIFMSLSWRIDIHIWLRPWDCDKNNIKRVWSSWYIGECNLKHIWVIIFVINLSSTRMGFWHQPTSTKQILVFELNSVFTTAIWTSPQKQSCTQRAWQGVSSCCVVCVCVRVCTIENLDFTAFAYIFICYWHSFVICCSCYVYYTQMHCYFNKSMFLSGMVPGGCHSLLKYIR